MKGATRYRQHPPIYRGAPPKAQSEVEILPVLPGQGECPHCHGGVALISWRQAQPLVDIKGHPPGERAALRVPRIASHGFGGVRTHGCRGYLKCAGSYEIPVRTEPLEES